MDETGKASSFSGSGTTLERRRHRGASATRMSLVVADCPRLHSPPWRASPHPAQRPSAFTSGSTPPMRPAGGSIDYATQGPRNPAAASHQAVYHGQSIKCRRTTTRPMREPGLSELGRGSDGRKDEAEEHPRMYAHPPVSERHITQPEPPRRVPISPFLFPCAPGQGPCDRDHATITHVRSSTGRPFPLGSERTPDSSFAASTAASGIPGRCISS